MANKLPDPLLDYLQDHPDPDPGQLKMLLTANYPMPAPAGQRLPSIQEQEQLNRRFMTKFQELTDEARRSSSLPPSSHQVASQFQDH